VDSSHTHETKPEREAHAVKADVGPSNAREVLTEKMDGTHKRSAPLHLQGAAAGAIRTDVLPNDLQHKQHQDRLCPHFAQWGWFKFGDGCKFSHSGAHSLKQAQRFAQGAEAYIVDDLPWCLTKLDEYRVKRLIEAVCVGGVDAAIPIVRAITDPKWQDHKFHMTLTFCVCELFNTSRIFQLLSHAVNTNLSTCRRPQGHESIWSYDSV